MISGGIVRSSVLSYNVTVQSWSEVDESVVMDDVEVGRFSRIKKAIIDKHNTIPPYTQIGMDPQEDRKKFHVTPRGIVVVPQGLLQERGVIPRGAGPAARPAGPGPRETPMCGPKMPVVSLSQVSRINELIYQE